MTPQSFDLVARALEDATLPDNTMLLRLVVTRQFIGMGM